MGNSDKTSDAKKAEVAKPGASNAGASKPGASNVGASKPGASKPGASKPGASNAGASNAGASNAGASNAGASNAGASNAGASKPNATKPDAAKNPGGGKKPATGPPATENTQSIPVRTAAHSGDTTGSGVNTERPPSRQSPQRDTSRPSTSHSHQSTASSSSKASTKRSYGSTTSGGSSSSGGSEYDRYHVLNDALRVFRDSTRGSATGANWYQIQQDSSEYLEMRRCVNVAMGIVGRSQNRAAMATYSTQLVDLIEYDKVSTAGGLNTYSDEMHIAISRWLDKMKDGFPDIYIHHTLRGSYAETGRLTWGTDYHENVPREAAYIDVHYEIFERLCKLKQRWADSKRAFSLDWEPRLEKLQGDVEKAQQNKNTKATTAAKIKLKAHLKERQDMESQIKNYQVHYERSLFHLGVTLAHECFHVLTGLWTGTFELGTPYKLGGAYADRDPEKKRGEAGDWWEYQSGFNGSVNLAWGKNDKKKDDPYPLIDDNLSAGVPFVRQLRYRADGSGDGVAWTRISHAYIKDIINKGISNKTLHASNSGPIIDSEFLAGFASVVDWPGNQPSTATALGRATKATPTPAKQPQNEHSQGVRSEVPLICEECRHGSHTVPLGCRGPKATEVPRA